MVFGIVDYRGCFSLRPNTSVSEKVQTFNENRQHHRATFGRIAGPTQTRRPDDPLLAANSSTVLEFVEDTSLLEKASYRRGGRHGIDHPAKLTDVIADVLLSPTEGRQKTELAIAVALLNAMLELGGRDRFASRKCMQRLSSPGCWHRW
jgi:hypothetical protein